MTARERAALWRQRLLEAETGMTTFLIDRHAGLDLVEWLHTQAEIFAELPDRRDEDPAAWQRAFFRAQALMEKFIVTRWGESELSRWAAANGTVFGRVEPEPTGGPEDVIDRLARQADLYASRYEVRAAEPGRASLVISHCGIWDYRERARAGGVPLTLASPCTFCTHALSENIRSKGYTATYRLLHDHDGDLAPHRSPATEADARTTDPTTDNRGADSPGIGRFDDGQGDLTGQDDPNVQDNLTDQDNREERGDAGRRAGSVEGMSAEDHGCVWTASTPRPALHLARSAPDHRRTEERSA